MDFIQKRLDYQLISHDYSAVALPGSTRSALYKKIQAEGSAISYTDMAQALVLKDRKVKEITGEATYAKLPLTSEKLAVVEKGGDIFLMPQDKQLGSGTSKNVYKAFKINDLGKFEVWADLAVIPEKSKRKKDHRVESAKEEDSLAGKIDSPNVIEKSRHQIDYKRHDKAALSLLQPLAIGSLSDVIKNHPLEPKEKVWLIREAAKGVKALHDQKILHRDIKPENILVYQEGSGWQVKIADLGSAVEGEAVTAEKIPAGKGSGTPYYTPKEAYSSMHTPTPDFTWTQSTDIYALGKTLDQMLELEHLDASLLERLPKENQLEELTTDHCLAMAQVASRSNKTSYLIWTLSQRMMGAEENRPNIDEVILKLGDILG